MQQLRVGDAIGWGLNAPRRDPQLFVALTALQAFISVLTLLIASEPLAAYVEAMGRAAETSQANNAPLEPPVDAIEAFARDGRVLTMLAIQLVAGIVIQGALLRLLARGEVRGARAIALGADELRLALVNVIAFGAGFGAFFVASLIGGALDVAGAAAFGAAIVLLGPVVSAWIGLRLSPAAACTVGDQAAVVTGAWRISQGATLFLALSYVITLSAGLFIYLLALMVLGAPLSILGTAGMIIMFVILGAFSVCWSSVWVGIGAYLYRMRGDRIRAAETEPRQREQGDDV